MPPFVIDCLLPELQRLYARRRAPVSTLMLATRVGVAERTARRYLVDLERAQVISRLGARGGWVPCGYVALIGRDGSVARQFVLPGMG